jgi:hypothetical protein
MPSAFFGGKTMGKRNTATSARQLSAKINEIRKRQGISPFALSKKTGLKPDTVKRVLGIGPEGRKNAGKANLVTVFRVLVALGSGLQTVEAFGAKKPGQ